METEAPRGDAALSKVTGIGGVCLQVRLAFSFPWGPLGVPGGKWEGHKRLKESGGKLWSSVRGCQGSRSTLRGGRSRLGSSGLG